MFKKMKADYTSWILLIGILLLLLEISFFNGGLIFSLLLSIGCIYFGRKWMPRLRGKILFWFGWISLLITILNMMTFRYFILAILLYLLLQFFQSKKNPELIKPVIYESEIHVSPESEPLLKRQRLFGNQWFGTQKTPEHVYEWNDVNIQGGIGDTIIDLSYTVLPKGESVISIRQFIGNLQILVPYEVEVSVSHSVIAGAATIFEQQEPRVINEALSLQTAGYETAEQKVKIITSLITGNLEVKRV
ncbi:cell wall-active antibiotics response protein LiaF [Metabacillus herbersteinensis]|uniref:Cell wall-active antibiotics response protein LiaF n=1 Tax=Metabacillus herbersteinensis TaxID=283816 RepID=A0ABV6GFB5_9BACI